LIKRDTTESFIAMLEVEKQG